MENELQHVCSTHSVVMLEGEKGQNVGFKFYGQCKRGDG